MLDTNITDSTKAMNEWKKGSSSSRYQQDQHKSMGKQMKKKKIDDEMNSLVEAMI
jgi:hypothetical protein